MTLNSPAAVEQHRSGVAPKAWQLFQALSPQEIEDIHVASLRVLEQVGVRVDDPGARDLLKAHGARLDDHMVHLPARLVEQAIASAPAQVTLYARDPQHDVFLGEGRVHFTNGFGATWVLDPATGQARNSTLADLESFTRLADGLERVDYVLFSVVPQDVPPRLLDVVCTASVLQNTSKHVQLSLEGAQWLEETYAIGAALAEPGRPVPFSAGGVPNSPLHYSQEATEKFVWLARKGVPCFIVVGAMAGATAPVTLAGLLTLQNAEFLAGLALTQLAAPGAPVIYGTFSGGFDMRYTKLAGGGPELALITAATQQLANRYGVPLGYATAGLSDSLASDLQAGMEKAFGIVSAALAGVDVIHDAISGLLGSGMLISAAQMVVDHETCSAAAYLLRGLPVTPDSLAEEAIARVGPGGNYLTDEHTARNFRQALYMTSLRTRGLDPQAHGGQASRYSENAARKAQDLLAHCQPAPVNATAQAEISAILASARAKVNDGD